MLSIPYGKTMTYGEIASKVAEMKGLHGMSAVHPVWQDDDVW